MHLTARVLLAVVCLGLSPVSAQAATITTDLGSVGPGTLSLDGRFDADNDIALFQFILSGPALVSAEITSHLATPTGFDPILTLFGPGSDYLGAFDFLDDNDVGFLDPQLLPAGTYLLAVTQYNNYFSPGNGFDYDAAPNGFFTNALFGPGEECDAFVAFDGGCRQPFFDGTLTITQVPEPAALLLLTLAYGAAAARRRQRQRTNIPTG